jgi:Flp pilus assembly CpaE family ATPase
VERALETKIGADLPSDRAVPLGVNRGKPVVLNDPGADFSKAIADLARSLMAETGSKSKKKDGGKKSLLSRMRS